MKSELLQTVDERAHAEGMNRSQYISSALEAYTTGLMTADITSSYSRDATRVLLLEHDIKGKDELLKERERLIEVLMSGQATVVGQPVKVGFWRRLLGGAKKD